MWLVKTRRLLRAALWVVGLVCVPSVLLAQSDEQRAAARSLATDGAKAFSEGRFKDAVDLFTKAESLVHAPPHLLYRARAHVKLGQLVRAREAYLKIIRETLPANAPKAFQDAQAAANNEVKDIEPRIGKLTVNVEGAQGVSDVTVMVDGAPLPTVLIGLPQPIDPGTHRIEAAATGKRAPSEPVTLGDGESKVVVVRLEDAPGAVPLAAAGAAPVAAAPAPAPAAAPPPSSPTTADQGPSERSSGSGLRVGAYIAFGVGAVGLAGGTVFALQSSSKRKDADDKFAECGGATGCTTDNPLAAEVDQLDSDAGSKKTLSIVGFAVGGVGVAAGVTLLLLSSGDGEQSAGVQPYLGLGTAGLRGRF